MENQLSAVSLLYVDDRGRCLGGLLVWFYFTATSDVRNLLAYVFKLLTFDMNVKWKTKVKKAVKCLHTSRNRFLQLTQHMHTHRQQQQQQPHCEQLVLHSRHWENFIVHFVRQIFSVSTFDFWCLFALQIHFSGDSVPQSSAAADARHRQTRALQHIWTN